MKKYWKLVVIALIVVVSVSTFYINSAISASNLPRFVIKKQSGDQAAIKSIELMGYYNEGTLSHSLTIDSKGTSYKEEQSFFESLNESYLSTEMKNLRKEYKGFMRGKTADELSFYEDKNKIAYGYISSKRLGVGPSDFKFKLSILDKKNKDESSFEAAVPNQSKYDNMYVTDVQLISNKLNVMTENYNHYNSDNQSEIHVYTFDIDKQKLISDDVITFMTKKDGDGYLQTIPSTNPLKSNKTIILERQLIQQTAQSDDSNVEENSKIELIAYNLETKAKEVIKLPKELQNDHVNVDGFDGLTIYFNERNETGFKVTSYDIEKKKISNSFSIEVPQMEEGNEVPTVIKNGKLYLVVNHLNLKESTTLIVADLKTKNIIYKGEIVKKDEKKEKTDSFMNVYNIGLK